MRRRRAPLIYRGGGRLWMTRPTHGCFLDFNRRSFSPVVGERVMAVIHASVLNEPV